MNINIKATGMDLTPAISEYVNKKVSSLDKYLGNASPDLVVQVEVGRVSNHHRSGDVYKAEVHITGDGMDYYAVDKADSLYAAIDLVKDEITREVRRGKAKQSALARRGGQIAKNVMKGFSWGLGKVKFKKNKNETNQ